MKKDPVFITLIVLFVLLFVSLVSAIIYQTYGIVTGKDEFQPQTTEAQITTEEVTESAEEIPEDLKEMIETGESPSSTASPYDTEEYTGEGDLPEDIEYIREDMPERERERLDNGTLWEPMDND